MHLLLVDKMIPFIPPEIPQPVRNIISSCLQYEPNTRPSAQQVCTICV